MATVIKNTLYVSYIVIYVSRSVTYLAIKMNSKKRSLDIQKQY